ncbi:MAG TPA: hypothetical protein VGG75_38420 [Trebonia sp.]|jgi:hypothetical protein
MAYVSFTAFPRRHDLVDEIFDAFNSNGIYTSGYYDSSGIDRLRVASYNLNGTDITFQVQESQLSSGSDSGEVDEGAVQVVRQQSLTVATDNSVYCEVPLTGRFFCLVLQNGEVDSPIVITLRAV